MTAPLKRHDYYLGPLGRLTAIRDPAPGYQSTPDLAVTSHKLLSGMVRTDRPAVAPRKYALTFDAVSDAEKTWLEQCALGYVGSPLYWVDPLVRNQLPPEVSTAPALSAFTLVVGSGSVSLLADAGAPGSRMQAAWVLSSSSSNKYFGPTVRLPVVPGLTFTASVRASSVPTAGFPTAQMEVLFYNATGTYISSWFGASAEVSSLYTTLSSTRVVPVGAVTAQTRLRTTSTGATVYLDSWQAEFGPLSAFAPGPGLARVSILSYDTDVYMAGITNVQMQMVDTSQSGVLGPAAAPSGWDGGSP